MGDTGSLFLGAMLVGCAMRVGRPFVMLLAGLVYVLEGISVMIQVTVFKLTHGKRRFFKMAPIHHHFELCGLSEVKIVALFLALTVLVCAASYYFISSNLPAAI
ncbi:MAG: phospho-N-acetylmuramoyl-pentapeptide-transferase, partial [Clostridia bacterium]|nr:phospho-N-acetylmuramoyl-pentapeptide-transferase [Clostridia bacterium]